MLKSSNVDDLLVRLDVMLKAGVSLKDSLKFLKKNKKVGKLAGDALWAMEEGLPFVEGIKRHLSPAEFSLLLAGEKGDNLPFAIQKTLYLRRAQKRIKSTLIGSLIYPVSIFSLTMFGLYYIGNKILPKLEDGGLKVAGILSFYKFISKPEFLIFLAVSVIVLLVGLIVFSTKFLGPYRQKTDRIFPFSFYRKWMGVIFIYMLSVLIKSGYQLTNALETIAESNPYFSWIVSKYLTFYRTSKNLGEAMFKSNFPIPDEDVASLLEVLSTFGRFDERLVIVAEDMIEGFVKNTESFSKIFGIATLVFAGLLVGGLVFGIYTSTMGMLDTIKVK